MSFRDCINAAENEGPDNGGITREQAQRARTLFDELEQQYQGRMNRAAAQQQAARDTFNSIRNDAIERRRRNGLMAVAYRQIKNNLDSFRNARGEVDYAQAASALFAPLEAGQPVKYPDVETRQAAYRARAHRQLAELLVTFNPNLLGKTRNKAKLKNLVYEVFGKDTGDASAREMAQSWIKVAEQMRLDFNRVGGRIAKRLDWGLPQFHDRLKVGKVTENEWIDYVVPRLDLTKMIDETTGLPFTEQTVRIVLKDVYETITTDGMNKFIPGKIHQGKGLSMANRRMDHRFLVFQGPEEWIDYQTKFGNDNPYDVMFGHINSMARDTAILEIFGPNPRAMIDHIKGLVSKQMGKDKAKGANAKLDNLYLATTGAINSPINEKFANTMATIRNLNVAAHLGSAILSAVTDVNYGRMARRMNGLPQIRTMTDYFRSLRAMSSKERAKVGIRMGLIADGWVGLANKQMRYLGEINGPEVTRRIADGVIRASFLSAHTTAGRWAFGMSFYGELADNAAKTFDQLPPAMQRSMQKYNIGSDKWDIIRTTPRYEFEGADFIRPEDIASRTDINPQVARELDFTLLELVSAETEFAVPSGGIRTRLALTGGAPRGTIIGELAESFAQYKNFGVQLVNTHIMRSMSQPGIRRKGIYFADLLISTTIMGAFALQMKEISKGRDFRPMDNPEFWIAAMLQGGGLGIYGDFLVADVDRFDRGLATAVAGPTVGFISDVRKLTIGNAIELIKGEDTNIASDMLQFASRNLPGTSLWYLRLGLERLVYNRLETWIDPNKAYTKRRRLQTRMKREYGQDYWWKPGTSKPDRAPDIENILAQTR
jgi:hypothetical protein